MTDSRIGQLTPEEIQLVRQALTDVIGGAIASEPDGRLTSMKELAGGIRALASTVRRLQDPTLSDLLETSTSGGARPPSLAELGSETGRQLAIERGMAQAVQALQLLEEKAGPATASAYADTAMTVATATVRAARTGARFGIGGVTVTEREAEYLRRLAGALGLEPDAAP